MAHICCFPQTPEEETEGEIDFREMAQNRINVPYRPPKANVPFNIETPDSQVEIPCKAPQVRWTDKMDGCMVSALMGEVLAGTKKSDNGFTSAHMKTVIDAVRNDCHVIVGVPHIRSRLKTLKKEYREVRELLQVSGFGFDATTSSVTADPSVWDDYVKNKPDAAKMKGKCCLYYDELATIYGNDTTTGSNSQSGGDYFPSMEGISQPEEDFVDITENEFPESESNNTSPQLRKRKGPGQVPRPVAMPRPKRKRGNVLDESARALAIIAESSRMIAAAMDSDAKLNTVEHVKWRDILDRLEAMEMTESDMLTLLGMFEADQGLARVFMGITKEAFAKSWALNKLYGN